VRLRLVGVEVGVVDHEEVAAGGNGGQKGTLGVVVRGAEQCRIVRGHEVESGDGEFCLEQATVHPRHLDMGLVGGGGGALQRHAGNVDRTDLPSSASQPYGVGTFTAPHVEGRARFEIAHFGDEGAVGLTAPDLLGLRIPFIPCIVAANNSCLARVLVDPFPVDPFGGRLGRWSSGRVGHGPASLPHEWEFDTIGRTSLPRQAAEVGEGPRPTVVAMAATSRGTGYWFTTANGSVDAYDDAAFHGSMPTGG